MSSNVEYLVSRYDNRPGYSVVDYEIVGLPIWKLSLITQVLEASPIAVTEKFVLRAVSEGVTTSKEVASLLGLDHRIVVAISGDLFSSGLIFSRNGTMSVSKKGMEVLAKVSRFVPRDKPLFVYYDPMIRKPVHLDVHSTWQPRELRSEGIRMINASPNRRPYPSELDRTEVESYMREAVKTNAKCSLMRVRSVASRRILFQKAIAIVFKAESGQRVQVGFVVNERISEAHEIAFREQNGIERYGISEALSYPKKKERSEEGEAIVSNQQMARAKRVLGETKTLSAQLLRIDHQINVEDRFKEDEDVREKPESGMAKGELGRLKRKKEEVSAELAQHSVRMVSVYEHPQFLQDALTGANDEVIIVSPWITGAVVDVEFLRKLRDALARGVNFYVGYGISKSGAQENSSIAEERLLRLAQDFPNLRLKRLGDTHAKVLIVDDRYVITTSFNWLSFRGDPKRTFREEWGTYVSIRDAVKKQAAFFKNRILS